MKRIFIFFSTIIILVTLNQKTGATPNPHPLGVEVDFFYSSLSPHGEWIEIESGFRVWRPLHMHQQWRPYLLGRWVWTDDYGWYWLSNEPFGWITYHYGRWHNDDYYGWVWMPDDVWGPAWVEWRYDDDYIGWAPLPPYTTFSLSLGIRFTTHWIAPVHYWNFVRHHRFGSIIRYRDVTSVEHTRRLIRFTRSGQQYEIDHQRIFNRGVDRTIIERHGHVRISKTEIRETREQSGERMISSKGSDHTQRIEFYRPSRNEIQQSTEHIEARRGDRALSIDMKKIEHPHAESRISSDERSRRDLMKIEERQHQQRRGSKIHRENRLHENTPRIQEQKYQQNRKEMRQNLMRRYERRQNPSPPTRHEAPQKRIERSRQSSPGAHPNRSAFEKRSSRGNDNRRE